jgi:hypothetical protein
VKRRSKNEICTIAGLPPGLGEAELNVYQDRDALLIPSYAHKSVIDCSSGAKLADSKITTDINIDIVYNSQYSYDGTKYHRDNYCMIPYKVPPMMLEGTVYALSESVLASKSPNISTLPNLVYDQTIWTQTNPIQFTTIVVKAYSEFADILNAGVCTEKNCSHIKGLYDYKNHPELYQCGPLDSVIVDYFDIANEYQMGWSSMWDMGVVNNIFKYGKGGGGGGKDDDDESSELLASYVYLGVIKTAPSGSGGTAIVTGVRVGSTGAVYETGPTFSVNLPSL